jgi:BirA family biotin operon repressor/biotin-[acetyl-CoA-carboxylase] ligase
MKRERQILQILNQGHFYSGEELAARLEVSRAAVWKIIQALQEQGIEIHAVRGRGYRLPHPLEFLEQDRIVSGLANSVRDWLGDIEIHQRIDSTNTYLLSKARHRLPSGSVCLAESQAAGRGRRGRLWVSPFAANLYLSLLWRFPMGPAQLTGLSLATGVAVAHALQVFGVEEIGLKWPNDLLWRQRKLGGILLEFDGEAAGPCDVVAGIGVNVAMPTGVGNAIDQPWVDLRTILGPDRISRNRLAAQVLNEIVLTWVQFEREGFQGISKAWQRFDVIAGKPVDLHLPTGTVTGIARGVDDSGALCLATATGIKRYLAGEISLRLRQ